MLSFAHFLSVLKSFSIKVISLNNSGKIKYTKNNNFLTFMMLIFLRYWDQKTIIDKLTLFLNLAIIGMIAYFKNYIPIFLLP